MPFKKTTLTSKQDAPPAQPVESIADQVHRQAAAIMAGYVMGLSFDEIGQALDGRRLVGMQIRQVVWNDAGLLTLWRAAKSQRADELIDDALTQARKCEPKDRAQLQIKLAEKLAPERYGQRQQLEISGSADGPPVRVDHMAPADAYKLLLGKP